MEAIIDKAANELPGKPVQSSKIIIPDVKPAYKPQMPLFEAGFVKISVPLPKRKPSHERAYQILNGTGRPFMAKRVAVFMQNRGVKVFAYANAPGYGRKKSVIEYAPGQIEKAIQMASLLPIPVEMVEVENTSADAVLTLGNDLLPFDISLAENKQYDI